MALILLAASGVFLWPSMVGHIRAAILLQRLSSHKVTRFQRLIQAPTVTVPVTVPSAIEPIEGHLFRRVSSSGDRGIILIHGFSPVGDNYPELTATAQNLAASGFAVLTPTIPHLTKYIVDEQCVRMIGESSQWLARETGGPVTLIGISFSGGPALVAASRPQYRGSVRQVVALSTYDDLDRLIKSYLTGVEPRAQGGDPEISGINVFAISAAALQFLDQLVPAEDEDQVRRLVQRSILLRQTGNPEDSHLFDEVSERVRTEVEQIIKAPEDFRRRFAAALSARRDDMNLLSPHVQVRSLTVPVTVISGINDHAIPTEEALWIAHDLPQGTLCRIYLTPLVSHVALSPHNGTGLSYTAHRLLNTVRLIHALAPAMETADPHWLIKGCPA